MQQTARNSTVDPHPIHVSIGLPQKKTVPNGAIKGNCAEGSRKSKSPNWSILGSTRPPASRQHIRRGGPTFPDGLPGSRRPFQSPKSTKLCFYLSAPFGTAPFLRAPESTRRSTRQWRRGRVRDTRVDRSLSYAIILPGRKSVFRAGFRPDSNRENLKIDPPAGRSPARGPI